MSSDSDDSVSDYEYGGCSMCSSDSDDSVSDQSKSRVGTRGLCISKMSICQLMLKWKMSLSDWSGNLEPTRGVISLAREFPNLKNERQNPIYINWPRSEQSPILLLLPSPEFLRWKLHKFVSDFQFSWRI